jgi:hypothetical protein
VRDRCPLCRKQIDMAQLTEGVSAPRDDDEEMEGGAASSSAGTAVVSESKLRVLLDEVRLPWCPRDLLLLTMTLNIIAATAY